MYTHYLKIHEILWKKFLLYAVQEIKNRGIISRLLVRSNNVAFNVLKTNETKQN